jgi:hypothetical protein
VALNPAAGRRSGGRLACRLMLPALAQALLCVAAWGQALPPVQATGDEPLRGAMERARSGAQPRPAAACEAGEGSERGQWLRRGEAALAGGLDEAALLAFERAAAIQHCADSEMGLVRSFMQTGQYRRAVSFVAHTASAHREVAGGAVLYAWLLHAGGQVPAAGQLLATAQARWPGDPLVEQARRALQSPAPVPAGALLAAPLRAAPYARPPDASPSARLAASGMLLAGGRHALVPWPAVAGAAAVWVRDGLGRTRAAEVVHHAPMLGLAVLRLAGEPDRLDRLPWPARDPFPGSQGFAVEYATPSNAGASWPLLRAGFVGAVRQDWRRLGIDMPPGPRGGPVFDAAGRLIGMAVSATGEGTDLLIPVSVLRRELGAWLPAAGEAELPQQAAPAVALDEIYERALPVALQVLVDPEAP